MGLRLVRRTHFEDYAQIFESKGDFPILISKLVRAVCLPSVRVDFPSGSAVFVGGWDGIVRSEDDRSYVPKGISLWELGTSNPGPKAESDYKKRTKDPKGCDPATSTLVIVTARFWEGKKAWRDEKMKEGIWKEILVYDSSDLEQWIDLSQAVTRWFAVHLNIYPFDGILDAEQFWEEYSIGPKWVLPPSVITSGRDDQVRKLFDFLNGPPDMIGIKASSKDESIAFIVAAALQFEESHREHFLSRSLIIDTEGNYRALRINSATTLNLIPRFENRIPMHAAVGNGHHVIVPLGGDDTANFLTIDLPIIRKEGQIEGLIEMGLPREEAEKYSRESGRNITILKRMLHFPEMRSKWLESQDLREIIPALLMGRWNETYPGDQQILEALSGLPYAEYAPILNKWRDMEESPLIQIGETWRLTSPLDLWSSLSSKLTEADFTLLGESIRKIFALDQDDEQDDDSIFSFTSRPKRFSAWAKEGLVQSLILISVYGESLRIPNLPSPKKWVDDLVFELLNDSDGKMWVALDQKLPLLSEASPDSFFKAVYRALATPETPILKMFGTKRGIISETGNHTGMLWALEGLAWLPEYLYDATVVLLKLAAIDPGGNQANRPANSLLEIYKIWHPQTLADMETRMDVLYRATSAEPVEGWKLLLRLAPKNNDHAMPTHKMRWRLFDTPIIQSYNPQEAAKAYEKVADFLLALFDGSEKQFAAIVSASINFQFSAEVSEKVLSFLEKHAGEQQSDGIAREALRKILSHHRKYPDAHWSAPEEVLVRYQGLYDSLEPKDPINRHKWLFDEHHIDFPDGRFKEEEGEEKWKKHYERVRAKRVEAIKELIAAVGLERVVQLGDEVKQPESIGESLAFTLEDEKDVEIVLQNLKEEKPNLALIRSFIFFKFTIKGLDWVLDLFNRLKTQGYDELALTELLLALPPSKELWDFIDNTSNAVASKFWSEMRATFYHSPTEEKIRGLRMLIQTKRFFTAVDTAYMMKEDIPADLIIEILQKAGTEKAEDTIGIKEYEVSSLFENLNSREDVPIENIAKLEWLYLPIIGSYGSGYTAKHLHRELANNPEFFIQILKMVYMPRNEAKKEEEMRRNAEDENFANYTMQGYRLMNNWQTIPGVDEDGSVNAEFLNKWIDEVRKLAEEADRLEVADSKIGYILAQYPETNKEYWPPDAISESIERINTHDLKLNFSIGITNKRSFTSRGPYDGGIIERANEDHFKKLANVHKSKHPNVSKIFSDIAARYHEDAKREDEDAERLGLEY